MQINDLHEIRLLSLQDAFDASGLVLASFEQHVAADWEPEARSTFAAECSPEHLRELIENATYAMGAFVGPDMAGVSLMPRPSLLKVFFIHPKFVRTGIGRSLWEATRRQVEAATPQVQTVELNASPYAVPFYRSVGFVPISREYSRCGWRATRMACWLPARSMGAEL